VKPRNAFWSHLDNEHRDKVIASDERNLPKNGPSVNADTKTVEGFGVEWTRFDQSALPEEELRRIFEGYFRIFPWNELPPEAVGFDLGCGSGRWAKVVASRVGLLHCIDASGDALGVARRNLLQRTNCIFHHASVDQMPIEDGTMDFGYSLGVLHHVPDTLGGIRACVAKLKPGAPFLVYLYYAFDNRPLWFRAIWRINDTVRRVVSRLPYHAKYSISQIIAVCVYFPLARLSRLAERFGLSVASFPLSAYRNLGFYTMRTDAFDRFGTRLEQRFTAQQIKTMMITAGLERIRFNEQENHWCAIGYKARQV
jgi:SAM-dependent methyltransferase